GGGVAGGACGGGAACRFACSGGWGMMRQRGIAVAVVLGLAAWVSTATAWAEDKPNPTGTWMYSFEAPNGQVIKSTMKLKLEGDKITGTVTGRDNQEAKIENGKIENG